MKVIDYENVVGCDIDDTILMWDNPTVDGPGKLAIEFAGGTVYLTPHNYHVQLLKSYRERGYYIIFWSANGRDHAARAVKALGLEELANGEYGHVQTKLCKHLDDNPNPESIIGPRVYCADITKPAPPVVSMVSNVKHAENLLQMGLIKTPEEYFNIVNGNRYGNTSISRSQT